MAQTVIATITIRNERLNGIMCMANILLQDIPQVPSMRRADLQKSTAKFPKLPKQNGGYKDKGDSMKKKFDSCQSFSVERYMRCSARNSERKRK